MERNLQTQTCLGEDRGCRASFSFLPPSPEEGSGRLVCFSLAPGRAHAFPFRHVDGVVDRPQTDVLSKGWFFPKTKWGRFAPVRMKSSVVILAPVTRPRFKVPAKFCGIYIQLQANEFLQQGQGRK